ncbi:MAG: putative outer membrane protein [Gemmatimonadetes bacterium]|nr:putative outer membrane protein [Gemmatimonadota bacterium]
MRKVHLLLVCTAMALSVGGEAAAQHGTDQRPRRAPQFLLAASPRAIPIDVAKTPILMRRIALSLDGASYREAIAAIVEQSGFPITYSDDDMPAGRRVQLRAETITIAAALSAVLVEADVDVIFSSDNHAVLVKRPPPPPPPIVGSITGRVTESATGQPVAFAQVTVSGTQLRRNTDAAGRFTFTGVPAGGHRVEVRRVGFAPGTRAVTVVDGGTVTADVVLTATPTTLAEVLTTVTGEQSRASMGVAISTVRADSVIREAPVFNVADLLNSRVPGAVIMGQNGFAGTVSPIRLRGLNSFTLSNNPIIIVDGARIESTQSADANTVNFLQIGGNANGSSRLGDLDMNEIESIDVVKGPAAATLYGTDAANGVLVIRTKRGRAGALRWDGHASYGISSQDTTVFPESYYGFGKSVATGAPVRCPLTAVAAGTCVQDSVTRFSPLKDGATTPISTGHVMNYGLQASGGTGQFKYMFSVGGDNELGWLRMPLVEQERILATQGLPEIADTQLRPNRNERLNLRANVSTSFGEKGEVTLSNGYVSRYFQNMSIAAFQFGYYGLGYNDPVSHGYGSGVQIGDYFQVRTSDNLTRYTTSLAGTYRPASWLSTRATLGLDYSNDQIDNLQLTGQGPAGAGRTGTRTLGNNGITQYSFDAGATASKQLTSALGSRTSAGLQYNRRSQLYAAQSGTGLPPGSQTVIGAAALTVTELHNDAVVVGTYLEEQISWRERLFLSGAVRIDGASTFGRDLNSAAYPKLSLSWLASDEPWLPRVPGLGSLRLRLAYGSSGVQPPSTAGLSILSLVTTSVGGTTASGVVPGTYGNPAIGPERQTELEGGVDLEAWGGRLRTEITGYSRKSTDALVQVPIPASAGGGAMLRNVGSVGNRGLEGLVTLRVIDRAALALDLTVNGSANKNELLAVNPDAPPGFFASTGFQASRHRVGYPLHGLWQRPIISYADANNDGIIVPPEIVVGDTEVYLGPASPTRNIATTASLGLWRDAVRLTAEVDRHSGYMRLNGAGFQQCALSLVCAGVAQRGPETIEMQVATQAYAKAATDYGFISDGSFTRLREVSATLRIPERLLAGVRSSRGSLTLSGRNLKLWSKWQGTDPETSQLTGFDQPYASSVPPPTRYFIARVNLSY